MEIVRVLCCHGCHLRFLDDGRFDRCPHCRRFKSIAAGEVRLSAVEGELDGPPRPLIQAPYRGEACEHGILDAAICSSCNVDNSPIEK